MHKGVLTRSYFSFKFALIFICSPVSNTNLIVLTPIEYLMAPSNMFDMFTRSHGHTVTCSHGHMFTRSHVHTVTCSHGHMFTQSHVHTVTWSHVHTVTCSHGHMFTRSHVHTVTCSHGHMFTQSHVDMFTRSHVHTVTCSHGHMVTRSHVHMVKFVFETGAQVKFETNLKEKLRILKFLFISTIFTNT
jgi:hypothetical protein